MPRQQKLNIRQGRPRLLLFARLGTSKRPELFSRLNIHNHIYICIYVANAVLIFVVVVVACKCVSIMHHHIIIIYDFVAVVGGGGGGVFSELSHNTRRSEQISKNKAEFM